MSEKNGGQLFTFVKTGSHFKELVSKAAKDIDPKNALRKEKSKILAVVPTPPSCGVIVKTFGEDYLQQVRNLKLLYPKQD